MRRMEVHRILQCVQTKDNTLLRTVRASQPEHDADHVAITQPAFLGRTAMPQ
jgi:hypothetical protein